MSFRLLPRDPKFFELFIADGDNLAAAAGALNEMVDQYDRLDERVAEHPGPREARRRDRPRDHAQARGRLRDPVRPRGHPRARVATRRRRRRDPGDRRDVRHLRRARPDARGAPAGRDPRCARGWSSPRRCASSTDSRISSAISSAVHELENEADGLSRAAVAKLFRDDLPPIEVIKWRDLYNDLEETIDAAEDAAEAMERMYHKAN